MNNLSIDSFFLPTVWKKLEPQNWKKIHIFASHQHTLTAYKLDFWYVVEQILLYKIKKKVEKGGGSFWDKLSWNPANTHFFTDIVHR